MKKLMFLTAAMIASVALVGCGDYSDGERAGVVTKFSRKGVVCKTWEGELVMGGLRNQSEAHTDSQGHTTFTNSLVANIFEFTVEDPKIVEAVQKKLESGEPATLIYKQEIIASPCRSSSPGDYFVVGVR